MDIRALILGQVDLPTKQVTIPEWKDESGKPIVLTVKKLTVGERDSYEMEMLENRKTNKVNIRAALITRSVIDENGNRVFSDKDSEELVKKNGVSMQRLYEA